VQSHNTILKRAPFKPNYAKVTCYLPNGRLVQSYTRREDYTPSTISRQMGGFDDRVFIHIVTPKNIEEHIFKAYYNPYYVLRSNTPSPLVRMHQLTQA